MSEYQKDPSSEDMIGMLSRKMSASSPQTVHNTEEPSLLMTPPLLSKRASQPAKPAMFDGFDGVHVNGSTSTVQTYPESPKRAEALASQMASMRLVTGSPDAQSSLYAESRYSEVASVHDGAPVDEFEFEVDTPSTPVRQMSPSKRSLQTSPVRSSSPLKNEVMSEAPASDTAVNSTLYHPKPQRLASVGLTSPLKQIEDVLGDGEGEPSTITTDHFNLVSDSPLDDYTDVILDGDRTSPEAALPFEPDVMMKAVRPRHNDGPIVDHGMTKPIPSRLVLDGGEKLVYYPAPIPVQLRLPPLLSKKEKASRRKSSMSMLPAMVYNPLGESTYLPLTESNGVAIDMPADRGDPHRHQPRDSFYGVVDRPHSPTGSISSGFATIESDNDDYQNNLIMEQNEAEKGKKAKKTKKKKAKKNKDGEVIEDDFDESHYFGRGGDGDDGEMPDQFAAFTAFDPSRVAERASMLLSNRDGIIPLDGMKPTSLIEELEIRKAGKREQKKILARDVHNYQTAAQLTARMHPLDQMPAISLLELQQQAEGDYNAHVYLHDLNRLSHHMNGPEKPQDPNIAEHRRKRSESMLGLSRSGAPSIAGTHMSHQVVNTEQEQERDVVEPLSARRARLKAQKQLAIEPEVETLAQRRARLKQQKLLAQPALVS